MKLDLRGAAMLVAASALLVFAVRVGTSPAPVQAAATPDTSASPIYDVDSPGRTGFESSFSNKCSNASRCTVNIYTVPKGKKLVVTHITCTVTSGNGDGPIVAELDVSGSSRAEYLPMTQLANQSLFYAVNILTESVFDSGMELSYSFALEDGDSLGLGVGCTTVGYLVTT